MSIDCQDIRYILHFGPPFTITEFVQKTGRGGRDENPAIVELYYGKPGKHINHNYEMLWRKCVQN